MHNLRVDIIFHIWLSIVCRNILCASADKLTGDRYFRYARQAPPEINIQVTAPLFTARLYDYGKSEGDSSVTASLDVGQRVELQYPVTFFGRKYTDLYVLSNGAIGFDQNSRNFKTDIFKSGPALIAPLWNRNDLRKGGQLYYREVTGGRILERAQSEIRYQYEKTVKPLSVFVVTWDNVKPTAASGQQQAEADTAKNTIQAALITTDNGTFVNFIYKEIGWSQGAEAGFVKGPGEYFFALPGSGLDSIVFLRDTGNTGIPGEWMFEVDQPDRILRCKPGTKGDACDAGCAEYEWGHDCENCCHCENGPCNAATGECNGPCKQCWEGLPSCNHKQSECKAKVKECGFNAISFSDTERCGETTLRCQCLAGYSGDGYTCTDINECLLDNNRCSPQAKCYNTPGRFYCECLPGFLGNGTICAESDESPRPHIERAISTTPTPPFDGLAELPEKREKTTTTQQRSGQPGPFTLDQLDVSTLAGTNLAGAHAIADGGDVISSNPFSPKPSEPSQLETVLVLPNKRNSRLEFFLNHPLTIFGTPRKKLIIHSTGFIALDDVSGLDADDADLEALNVRGFAPFFSRVDLGKNAPGGRVSVYETAQPAILADASNIVRQNFASDEFTATSVVTVTYENVTTADFAASQKVNTFLVLLVGGSNRQGQNVTFLEFVYADLQWADDAQALILTDDVTSIVALPGSGTNEVLELAQFSNIKSPGEWMYRVDGEHVPQCSSPVMLPPYCLSETPPAPLDYSEPSTGQTPPQGNHSTVEPGALDGLNEFVTFVPFQTVVPQLEAKSTSPNSVNYQSEPDLSTSKPRLNFAGEKPLLRPPQLQHFNGSSAESPNQKTDVRMDKKSSDHQTTDGTILPSVHDRQEPSDGGEPDLPPLQIFTTPKQQIAATKKKHVKAGSINTKQQTAEELDSIGDEKAKKKLNEQGLSSSTLAIIISTSVVGIWILILIIAVVFICFRRRRNRKVKNAQNSPRFHNPGLAAAYGYAVYPTVKGPRPFDPPSGTAQPSAQNREQISKEPEKQKRQPNAKNDTRKTQNQPNVSTAPHQLPQKGKNVRAAAPEMSPTSKGPSETPYGTYANSPAPAIYGSYWSMLNANRSPYGYYNNPSFYDTQANVSKNGTKKGITRYH